MGPVQDRDRWDRFLRNLSRPVPDVPPLYGRPRHLRQTGQMSRPVPPVPGFGLRFINERARHNPHLLYPWKQ